MTAQFIHLHYLSVLSRCQHNHSAVTTALKRVWGWKGTCERGAFSSPEIKTDGQGVTLRPNHLTNTNGCTRLPVKARAHCHPNHHHNLITPAARTTDKKKKKAETHWVFESGTVFPPLPLSHWVFYISSTPQTLWTAHEWHLATCMSYCIVGILDELTYHKSIMLFRGKEKVINHEIKQPKLTIHLEGETAK